MPSINSVLAIIFSLIFIIPIQKIDSFTPKHQPDPKVTQGYEIRYLWIRAARTDTILGKVNSMSRPPCS